MLEKERPIKVYLQRGWDAEQRVRVREEQLSALRDRMGRVRSAAPKGPAGDRKGPKADWTDAIDALTDAEAAYLKEISALYGVQKEIREAIEGVAPEHYKELLQYRYIFCLGWDEIADKMHYDKRYLFKLHDRALKVMEQREGKE